MEVRGENISNRVVEARTLRDIYKILKSRLSPFGIQTLTASDNWENGLPVGRIVKASLDDWKCFIRCEDGRTIDI